MDTGDFRPLIFDHNPGALFRGANDWTQAIFSNSEGCAATYVDDQTKALKQQAKVCTEQAHSEDLGLWGRRTFAETKTTLTQHGQILPP